MSAKKTKMGEYIKSILFDNSEFMLIWSVSNLTEKINGLRFQVDGLFHKGFIDIDYNDFFDSFDIHYTDLNGKYVLESDHFIFVGNLADTIYKKV